MLIEPLQRPRRVAVTWKNWVFDSDHLAIVRDHRQPLEQPHARHFQHRQAQGTGPQQIGIAQHRVRQLQSLRHFLLIRRGLGADRQHLCAQRLKLGQVIAITDVLRGATARTWDVISAFRQWHTRLTGHGVGIHHHKPLKG